MVWIGTSKVRGDNRGQGPVRLGDTLVPRTAHLEMVGDDGGPDGLVRCEIRDGRPEVVEITVKVKPDGRGIRSADMAVFNLDNLAVNIFGHVAEPIQTAPAEGQFATTWPPTETQAWAMRNDLHRARTAPRGARGPSREELEEVARIYREHVADAPVKAVAALLGATERTAARRVQQARAAGLLPPTTRGRKGI
ncbi:hypothetical protein [Pseudonocardia sp.]|uniref:hypothetical protein n=1 Tax=Pseudonocardia sp. TaxID=60912 RepID=UPI00260B15F3|nr:hypothetical protein [Pseudonocardia sp.]